MSAQLALAAGGSLASAVAAWAVLDEEVRRTLSVAFIRAGRSMRSTLREALRRRGARVRAGPGGGRRRAAERRAACLDEMPELIDVIALGLNAGISFDAALGLYCERYDSMLSALLGDAMRSWSIGLTSRRQALSDVARELDVDAFSTFVQTVTESLEFGAPLSSVLVSQAQDVRAARRSSIEERIEKVPVKMIVPTGTLILPAMLLSILGPFVASMSS